MISFVGGDLGWGGGSRGEEGRGGGEEGNLICERKQKVFIWVGRAGPGHSRSL